MKARKHVVIKKVGELADAKVKAASWDKHVPGADSALSLPVEYIVEGILMNDIVCGEPVRMDRTKRNGIEMLGFFVTSPVTGIDGDTFKTLNSLYHVESVNSQN
jgi:hypothetical protein